MEVRCEEQWLAPAVDVAEVLDSLGAAHLVQDLALFDGDDLGDAPFVDVGDGLAGLAQEVVFVVIR